MVFVAFLLVLEFLKLLGSIHDIAKIFGIGERCVRDLITEGLPRETRGKYDIAKCCTWYIERLKDNAKTKKTKAQKQAELIDLQIEEKQIDINERKGELLWRTETQQSLEEIIVSFRSEILGSTSKIAVEVSSEESARVQNILEREFRKMLNRCSNNLMQISEEKSRTRKELRNRKK